MSTPGRLVVVATPIGNLADLSPRAAETLASADVVACEDTRHTGVLLAACGVRARRLASLHAHNEAARSPELLELLRAGAVVALVSDAGTPLVSDPGARLCAAAADAGVAVSAVPGPSAVLAALVVSGFDVSRWRFEGFLPRKGPERRQALARVASAGEASVCYESPLRVAATLADLRDACGPRRRVAVAREMTKLHEEVWRATLGEAAERAGAGGQRGEHALVVEGAPGRGAPSASGAGSVEAAGGLEERLGHLLEGGLSRRDAALAAEELLGVAHRVAYAAALEAERRRRAGTPSEAGGGPVPEGS